jgi:hypothetical protein
MITFLFVAVLAVWDFFVSPVPTGLWAPSIVTEERQAKLHREEF